MAKINTKVKSASTFTHEGAVASKVSDEALLRRSVMSCLLWEDSFYESGEDIASRIKSLVAKNKGDTVAKIAIEARNDMKLRHVPLLLVREMARNEHQKALVADTLDAVIQRPDEIAEFLAIYWKDGKDQPLSAQVKKGLARAFGKFNEYELAKWNQDGQVSLRDALFLCHAKPVGMGSAGVISKAIKTKNYARGSVRRHKNSVLTKLAKNELKTPDTWETQLSAGADKKATFERLIAEGKLGAMALLRNLRGMTEANVSRKVIVGALDSMKVERVLPFRFLSAVKHAPEYSAALESAMFKCLEGSEKLSGTTTLLIDVSGSMGAKVSGKSELSRLEAASALAILLREICKDVRIYTFSDKVVEVKPTRGFALKDAIYNSQSHNGTDMRSALEKLKYGSDSDRLIVITDEQTATSISAPKTTGYMVNVASEKNGVGYGKWKHIDGWSESIVRYISELEAEKSH